MRERTKNILIIAYVIAVSVLVASVYLWVTAETEQTILPLILTARDAEYIKERNVLTFTLEFADLKGYSAVETGGVVYDDYNGRHIGDTYVNSPYSQGDTVTIYLHNLSPIEVGDVLSMHLRCKEPRGIIPFTVTVRTRHLVDRIMP